MSASTPAPPSTPPKILVPPKFPKEEEIKSNKRTRHKCLFNPHHLNYYLIGDSIIEEKELTFDELVEALENQNLKYM